MKSQRLFAFATFFVAAGATPLAEKPAAANHTRSLGNRAAPTDQQSFTILVNFLTAELSSVSNDDVGPNVDPFTNIVSETFVRIVLGEAGSRAAFPWRELRGR